MSDSILVSKDNAVSILAALFLDLKTKINNKDISLPYTTEFTKSLYIKINGDGTMYLSNNGTYIKIGTITQDKLDIAKINQIFSIIYQKEQWSSIKTNLAAYNFPCQQYNGKIYAVMGSYISVFDMSSSGTGTWSNVYTLPYSRIQPLSVLCNDKMYIIAGHNGSNDLLTTKTLGVYDITNNTYTILADIPSPRSAPGCVLYNGKIYCIGGYFNGAKNDIQIYDIASNTWSISSAYMAGIRCNFGCTLYNNKIYCIAGTNQSGDINTVEVYDLLSNTWSSLAPMSIKSKVYCAVAYNNKIYSIKGNGNVDIYNISTNTWSTGLTLEKVRYYFGYFSIDNKIYCVLGADNSYNGYSDILIYTMEKVSYNIQLPDSINTKLNKLINTGTGNKVFTNDGTYKSITPSYTVMTSDEIAQSLNSITSV